MSSCSPKNNRGEKKYLVTPIKANPAAERVAQGLMYDMELKSLLRAGEVLAFRSFLVRNKRPLPDEMLGDTLKMETMMHQLIVTMPDLSDLHSNSKSWLDNNTLQPQGQTLLQASRLSPEEKKQHYEAAQANRRTIALRPSFKPDNN